MRTVITTAVLLLAVTGAAPAQWLLRVEPNHSSINFAVPVAAGITKVRGSFREFTVDIKYDDKQILNSSVTVSINASSVDTNNDMRDADLKGEKFFDVAQHPTVTFKSLRIEQRAHGYAAVGPLQINGITKIVEVPFTIAGTDAVNGRPLIGIDSSLKLNRKDFDLGTDWRHSAIPNFLGDSVTIDINVVTRPGTREATAPRTQGASL